MQDEVHNHAGARIATLTLNPAIDVAYAVNEVFHTRKMRTHGEHYTPGGGGINVARVFTRLGGTAHCVYLAGGATGATLDGLLEAEGLDRERIAIEGHTRICVNVFEDRTGKEYRLVPPGPQVLEREWQDCLERLSRVSADFIVASGSLAPGVPVDFYGRVARIAAARKIRMVLDSSGPGLRGGLSEGGLHLVKPSIGELRQYTGSQLASPKEIGDAAMALVEGGQARIVAVTLGQDGAVLASEEGIRVLPAVPVETRSAVGAGDSFLAAMVHGLAAGRSTFEAFRLGLAAGAAAVLAPGGDLCQADETARLLDRVSKDGSPDLFT